MEDVELWIVITRGYVKARTTEVTWTVQLPEKFENAIFGGIFQIPATE